MKILVLFCTCVGVLISCDAKKTSAQKDEPGKWITSLESERLKGDVLVYTETRDMGGKYGVMKEIFYFDKNGMLEKRIQMKNDSVERESRYFCDESNRLLRIESSDGTYITVKYDKHYTSGKYYAGESVLWEYEYNNEGRVLRSYFLTVPSGERMDSTVFTYSGERVLKEETFMKDTLKLIITHTYDKNGMESETNWVQYIDPVEKIDTRHYYDLDKKGNWVKQLDVRGKDTVFVKTREIIYREK